MSFAAGNVVVLKSGGQPMTVVAVSGDDVECIWIGEDGDFFRHAIPAVALEVIETETDHDEDDEDEHDEEHHEKDHHDEDEHEDDDDEDKKKKKRKRAA